MLDLISSGEGGYASVNPGLKRPEILNMTISELVQFQYQSKERDGGSAAVGKYQFMIPEYAAKLAGLPMTAKFTPENQDKMAIAYLEKKRRGKEWLSGKISNREYIEDLSREWGAFRSYSGYVLPGNSGKIGPEKIEAALNKVKSAPQQAPTQPSPAQTTSAPTPAAINPSKTISKGTKVGDTIKTDFFGSMGVGRKTPHGGIDLGCDVGTYISCKYPCKVVEARYQDGYGYYTDIIIPSLNIRLRFAHLSSQLIKSGDVPAGKPFARSGNSGTKTTGPHIHMEATRKMGGTAYGGDFNPDPYVDAMIFSKKPPQGFVAPAVPSTNITPPAQIAVPKPGQQVSAAPKKGQQVAIINDMPQQQMQAPQNVGAQPAPMQMPMLDKSKVLNSLIKNHLLLDLAYT
jgi:hypothetical protein